MRLAFDRARHQTAVAMAKGIRAGSINSLINTPIKMLIALGSNFATSK